MLIGPKLEAPLDDDLKGVNGGRPARLRATAALKPYLSLSCMYESFRPTKRLFSFSSFSLCAKFLKLVSNNVSNSGQNC